MLQVAGRDFHLGLSTAESVCSKAALVQDFSEIGGPSGFRAVQHTGMFRGAERGEAPCLALSNTAPGLRLSLGPARTAVRQHK